MKLLILLFLINFSSAFAYSQQNQIDFEMVYIKKLLQVGDTQIRKENGDTFRLSFYQTSTRPQVLLARLQGRDNHLGTSVIVDVKNMKVSLQKLTQVGSKNNLYRLSITGESHYLYKGFINLTPSFFNGNTVANGLFNFGANNQYIFANYNSLHK